MDLVDGGVCFVCGKRNEEGLKLDFLLNKELMTVEASFSPGPKFQGFQGIIHGGIIATLLDEAMGKVAHLLGLKAVTASLEIKFRKPVKIKEKLFVKGEVTRITSRLVLAKATIKKEDGSIVAEASGKLLRKESI